MNEVDEADEALVAADGQVHDERHGAQLALERAHRLVEVGAELVHFVDVGDARYAILLRLAPHGPRLRLDAFGVFVVDGQFFASKKE